jgi:hypothetical protein
LGSVGTKDDEGRRELTQGMASCPAKLLGETVRTGGCPNRYYRLPWQELLSCGILAIPAAAAGIQYYKNSTADCSH